MINPYESPQTTDAALPQPRPQLDPHQGVLRGAQLCARGGKLLMAAAASELVASFIINEIQRVKHQGPTNLLNLAGWIFIYGAMLLLLIGTITNHLAYSRFIAFLDQPDLEARYRYCRGLNWLRLAVVTVAILLSVFVRIPEHKVLAIGLSTTLMICFLRTYWQHSMAMKIWLQHFPAGLPGLPPLIYWWSGLCGTLLGFGMTVYSFQEQRDPSLLAIFAWGFILLLSFAAFVDFYTRLAKLLASLPSIESASSDPDSTGAS